MFYYRASKNDVKVRTSKEKNETPTYAPIDSQSVKTVSASQNRGYDGGKTKGVKRHIVTDTVGNLLSVHVHAANIHDTKGGVYTFEKALYRYPTIIGGRADNGYKGTLKKF